MSTSLFIELIQVTLVTRKVLSQAPSAAEWASIFSEAQRQAVVGIIAGGMDRLPQEQRPQKEMLLQWIGLSLINENSYRIQVERAAELTERFTKSGIKSCVLKGLGFAQYYPVPAQRQGGDIDLWVDGKREDVMKWLRGQCEIKHIVWHHVDAKLFDDVETEIHFHPGWLYNPLSNRRLQKWFEREKEGQMVVKKELGFACPTVRFNAVYSLVHLYHHLIEEGIGIRHIIYYYYILKALPAQEKEGVLKDLRHFGLLKLASAMMCVLQEVCAMPSDYVLCEPDEKEGRFLLDEIMRGGNFGHHRKDNRHRNSATRMLALLPHYPSEVLWIVPWKLWHKCWRVINAKRVRCSMGRKVCGAPSGVEYGRRA